jgi:aminoglycoside phosphotransferase (APT) family kinase protein
VLVPVLDAASLSRRLLGRAPDTVEPLVVWPERATYRVGVGAESFVLKGEDAQPGWKPELQTEIDAHRHAAANGIPVPELVAADDTAFAMRWVDGVPVHVHDTDAGWHAAADVVRAIHALDPIGTPGVGFGGADGTWFGSLVAEVEFEGPRCLELGLDPAALDRMRSTLVDARADIEKAPIVWCHGDLQPDHILIDPATDAVTAVIDWSDHGQADGAWDIALLTLDHDRLAPERTPLVPIYQQVRLLGEMRWLADHGFDTWRDAMNRLTTTP